MEEEEEMCRKTLHEDRERARRNMTITALTCATALITPSIAFLWMFILQPTLNIKGIAAWCNLMPERGTELSSSKWDKSCYAF